jgi:hypothetical protein
MPYAISQPLKHQNFIPIPVCFKEQCERFYGWFILKTILGEISIFIKEEKDYHV